MTIQDLGAVGELLGAIAVIASVLYLARQIRHGLQGYQSNITQQITTHFSTLQIDIAKSEGLVTAWAKAQKGEPLTELENVRVIQVIASYMIGFENMFSQNKLGMLSNDAWNSRRVVIARLMKIHGASDWWQHFGQYQHPKDFVAEVEAIRSEFSRDATVEPPLTG